MTGLIARTNLQAQSQSFRRVTIMSNVFVHAQAGPSWLAYDETGSQYPISADHLPPGLTQSMVEPGQQWFVENKTNRWTLDKIVGNNPPGILAPNPSSAIAGMSLTADPNSSTGMSWRNPQNVAFHFSGTVTVGSILSVPYFPLATVPLNIQTIAVGVATVDASNSITVGFYLNGTSVATLTLSANQATTTDSTSVRTNGVLTDILQAKVTTYAGSAAANLTAQALLT